MIRLDRIFVYPIKSAAGIEVDASVVGEMGLVGDRRFMLVDDEGVFLSQRSHPRMALLRPAWCGDRLRVAAPGMPDLDLPRELEAGPPRPVRIWDDTVPAVRAESAASAWFADFLGARCSLVFFPHDAERRVARLYGASRVAFADAFPFLLVSVASLEDLNRRLPVPVGVDRFRPNLLVGGCAPYDEDRWLGLEIGEVGFAVAKPCARCSITTVEQTTGERGAEPLATLASYRREAGKVILGQNLVHEGRGELRVGDAVRVRRRRGRGRAARAGS